MSKDDVSHRGVVKSTAPGLLTIRTDDGHKCEGCAITAICGSGKGSDNNILTIATPVAADFAPGDRVEVTASTGSTLRATWWALILPTLIFAGTTIGLRLGALLPGGWPLTAGFGALLLYDLYLYRHRRQLAQKISWKVTKL